MLTDIRTYGHTDIRTYGRTDGPSYRDARTHLKTQDDTSPTLQQIPVFTKADIKHFSQAEMVKNDMTNFLFAVESCFLLVFCCFYHIWWLLKVKESHLSVSSCCV